MRSTPSVGEIRFHPADLAHRDQGLLGWVTAEIDSVLVDGLAIRRTREGRLTISFPERRDAAGRRRALVRPRHPRARAAIESQVIEALRRGAHIP